MLLFLSKFHLTISFVVCYLYLVLKFIVRDILGYRILLRRRILLFVTLCVSC